MPEDIEFQHYIYQIILIGSLIQPAKLIIHEFRNLNIDSCTLQMNVSGKKGFYFYNHVDFNKMVQLSLGARTINYHQRPIDSYGHVLMDLISDWHLRH